MRGKRLNAIQPELVVHSVMEFLLAAQVPLSSLHTDMPEEELDLFQFASSKVT